MRCLIFYIIIPALIATGGISCKRTAKAQKGSDAATTNNLFAFYLAIHDRLGIGDQFPRDLSGIYPSRISDEKLLLPENVSSNLDLKTINDQFTRFIYVGGASIITPSVALLIAPPVNHQNYGFVINASGQILRLPADTVNQLISDPFFIATNSDRRTIEAFRPELNVVLPEKKDRTNAAQPKLNSTRQP